MGEQGVVVLDERIRGERQRRDLEAPRTGPLVQGLDVREHLLALEPSRVYPVDGERPEHEGVVGVWTVSDADPQAPDASTVGIPTC